MKSSFFIFIQFFFLQFITAQSFEDPKYPCNCESGVRECGQIITMGLSKLTKLPPCVDITTGAWEITIFSCGIDLPIAPVITKYGHNGGAPDDFVPMEIEFEIPCGYVAYGECRPFQFRVEFLDWELTGPCDFNPFREEGRTLCVCNNEVTDPDTCTYLCISDDPFWCDVLIEMDITELTTLPTCVNLGEGSAWSLSVLVGNIPIVPTITQMANNGGYPDDYVPVAIEFTVPCSFLMDNCCYPLSVEFEATDFEIDEPCYFDSLRVLDSLCLCDDGRMPPDTCKEECLSEIYYDCGELIELNVAGLTALPECINLAEEDAWTISVVLNGETVIIPAVTQLGNNGGYPDDYVPIEIEFVIPCDPIPDTCCYPFEVEFELLDFEMDEPCYFDSLRIMDSLCVCNGIDTSFGGRPAYKFEPALFSSIVAPNPARNFVKIKSLPGLTSYSIYNLYGQEVMRGAFEGEENINVSSLSEGLYIIELRNSYVSREKLKFIIQR